MQYTIGTYVFHCSVMDVLAAFRGHSMRSMPTDTHIHILLTHTYSTVNKRIPNRCTTSHTYMCAYIHVCIHTWHTHMADTHGIRTHMAYTHSTHHTNTHAHTARTIQTHMHTPHTHSQHTYLYASKQWTLPEQGLSQICIIYHRNTKIRRSNGTCTCTSFHIWPTVSTNTQPHQHSATPTSTHQYPTHSHTDILPTGIPHNHPIHTNTHSSHTHPQRSRDEGLERGLGLARSHLHALWKMLVLIWILAGREMEPL